MTASASDGARRQRWQPEARRADILVAAMGSFVAGRYDDVAIEDIAAAANVSKALIYHYFGSKRGLYLAVVEALGAALVEAARMEEGAPLALGLERSLRSFHAFLQVHGTLFRSLVRGGVGSDREVEAMVAAIRERIAARLWPALLGATAGSGEEGQDSKQMITLRRCRLQAFLGAVEALAVDSVDHGDVDEDDFVMVALGAAALLGAQSDPLRAGGALAPSGLGVARKSAD